MAGSTNGPRVPSRALAAAVVAFSMTSPVLAQSISLTGSLSAMIDALPNVPRSDVTAELRLRAIVDAQIEAKPWLRFRFAGVADRLAERGGPERDAAVDELEAWVEVSGARADIRAGVGRLAWGRLDEVQPTDVINPIDVARFLLEGRSEARLPVAFVRARLIPSDKFVFEAVAVPVFRPGTFDRLDEDSSPFNLFRDLPPPVCPPGVACPPVWRLNRETPDRGDVQAGARIAATTGRIDWGVSAWTGFVPFGLIGGVDPDQPGTLRLVHPAYRMFGADLETVTGKWAWRAEAAWFPERPLQVENEPRTFEGDSLEAGAGVDRRAGDFTLSGTVFFRRTRLSPAGTHDNVSVVAGFSRSYDRVETRLFALVNPEDEAAFVRGVLSWKPVADFAVETSVGWFVGDGNDAITRFGDRDFGYVRLKYYFGR
jgi:hypothetical protein